MTDDKAPRRFKFILPGANIRDRALATLAAILAIGLTGLACSLVTGGDAETALIVAPMGASAVLLFAVPSSPLAQPWSIVGGNVISAFVGIAVARFVPHEIVASGLAVGLAILAMTVTRSLHPPGAASALIAVIGGPEVAADGFLYALVPVGMNAALLTALGVAFHQLTDRQYPTRRQRKPAPSPIGTADLPPLARAGHTDADIEHAIADLGEAYDISHDDLSRLLRQVERRTLERTQGKLTCADIMSRDVIRASTGTKIEAARRVLLDQGVRTLPVIDRQGIVLGCVGLREVAREGEVVDNVMVPALTARPGDGIVSLVDPLTDGRHHAAVVIDDEGHLLGLVTQTDLLAALARSPRLPR